MKFGVEPISDAATTLGVGGWILANGWPDAMGSSELPTEAFGAPMSFVVVVVSQKLNRTVIETVASARR